MHLQMLFYLTTALQWPRDSSVHGFATEVVKCNWIKPSVTDTDRAAAVCTVLNHIYHLCTTENVDILTWFFETSHFPMEAVLDQIWSRSRCTVRIWAKVSTEYFLKVGLNRVLNL
jgi:hypothetical protein